MSWLFNQRRVTGVALALAVLGTAACSDFLKVSDPGRFTDEALNTPLALNAVVNGVEGDLWGNQDDFATFHGLMSDELQHTGTWAQWEDMDQGRLGPAIGTDNGVFNSLANRRTAALNAVNRLNTVMGDTASRSLLMARAVTTQGMVELLLGMHACEGPKEAFGEIITDLQLYAQAIPFFTSGADIARLAGNAEYERLAMAGRARAKLLGGDLPGALADAATVPDDFAYYAKFSETGTQNSITSFAHYTRLKAGGLDPIQQSKVDTVAGFVRDPFTNELDNRLEFSRRANGADGVRKFYNQEKYASLADDIRMASGWEMRLIEAEVHMKQNNLAQAVTLINRVRANAGLSPHNGAGATAAQVQEWLLWERFAELYLEGHRLNDLYRFNLVTSIMGPNRATKFPMSAQEITLNPHVNGVTAGRCPTMS